MRTRTARRAGLGLAMSGAMLAAGCGGGGGGGNEDVVLEPVVVAPGVALDETNMPGVAVQALDAGGAGGGTSLSVLTGAQVEAGVLPAPAPMGATARLLRRALVPPPDAAVVGITRNRSLPCTLGGQLDVAAVFRADNTLTPGDTLRLNFVACREPEGTIDGAVRVTVIAGRVSGDTIPYLDASVVFNALSATSGSLRERLDGSARLTTEEGVISAQLDVSSDRLRSQVFRNGTLTSTRNLLNYSYRMVTDTLNGQTSETFAYRLTGIFPAPIGERSWDAQTTVPVVTPGTAPYPTQGQGVVTGANGTLRLTVQPANAGVLLELDLGNNGSVDATRLLSWAELDALR